jgi:hypothetical protein
MTWEDEIRQHIKEWLRIEREQFMKELDEVFDMPHHHEGRSVPMVSKQASPNQRSASIHVGTTEI